MQMQRFHYEVKAEVTLTGRDLAVLEYHAKRHYDGTCREFFDAPQALSEVRGKFFPSSSDGQGGLWLGEFRWCDFQARFGDDPSVPYTEEHLRHPSENPDLAITVTVSSRTLDLCCKILERLGFGTCSDSPETRALLEKIGASGQRMSTLAGELRDQMVDVFHRLGDEWGGLNSAEDMRCA